MSTTEMLSALVTVILVLIFFTKMKGTSKKTGFNQIDSAKPEDVELVRLQVPEGNETQLKTIAYNIRNGNLIEAIKIIREAKNVDLKKSKDLVELLKKQFN